jgi:hypothetical protein
MELVAIKWNKFQLNDRVDIALRIMAAVGGGYGLATLAILVLAYVLPGGRAQGLLMGMMLSFLFYAAAIIWAFAANTALRAWLGLGVVAVPLAFIYTLIADGSSI